jgi:molybdopterin converting factor small subunit
MATPVRVSVHLHGYLQAAANRLPLEVSVPPSLEDALEEIQGQVPGLADKLGESSVLVLLNGVNLHRMKGRAVTLADGDRLDLVPFVAGG